VFALRSTFNYGGILQDMSPRFYVSLWSVAAVAALVVWGVGAMTMLTIVVFGFLAFGLTFVGMMCVLPGWVAHRHEVEHAFEPTLPEVTGETPQPAGPRGYAVVKAA
jgi:hypothetical protein